MDTVFEHNLQIIRQRWPHIAKNLAEASLDSFNVVVEQQTLIINEIQLTSNYDRTAEAELQCSRIEPLARKAYVYGVGLGDVPLCLLERKNIQSVVICILNIDLFLHSLNALSHIKWLSDSRVSLVTSNELNDVSLPFVALPIELHFAAEHSAVLRDRVVVELNHEYAMLNHISDNEKFQKEIMANEAFIKMDNDVGELFQTIGSEHVFIVAAGPTLNQNIEILIENKNKKYPFKLIALDVAVAPLLLHDITPDIVVSIDARASSIFNDIDLSQLRDSQLVYFPRISPGLIEQWSGKRFCAYSQGELYKEINNKYPKSRLYSAGSVIHSATDLAIKMGAKEVTFFGADFGFPGGKTYAKGQNHAGTQQFISSEHWVINGHGEKITTILNYRAYLRDLERYIEKNPSITFYNTSLEGAKIEGTKFYDTSILAE